MVLSIKQYQKIFIISHFQSYQYCFDKKIVVCSDFFFRFRLKDIEKIKIVKIWHTFLRFKRRIEIYHCFSDTESGRFCLHGLRAVGLTLNRTEN